MQKELTCGSRMCNIMPYDEDGFNKGKTIIEAGDGGNGFRVFGFKNTSTYEQLTVDDFENLLIALQNYKICIGNDDSRFVEFCELQKGKFTSVKKSTIALLDDTDNIHKSARHIVFELLIAKETRCNVCNAY